MAHMRSQGGRLAGSAAILAASSDILPNEYKQSA